MNRTKKIILLSFSSVIMCILGIYAGYLFGNQESSLKKPNLENNLSQIEIVPENTDETETTAEIVKNNKIIPSTKIIYEYFYEEDSRIETNSEDAPYFLIGLTKEELEETLVDWEITDFSEGQVIMRKNIEGESTEHYIIGVKDGYIAVFYDKEVNGTTLKEITNSPIISLSEEEQSLLKTGIPVLGEDNLIRVLEDYGS